MKRRDFIKAAAGAAAVWPALARAQTFPSRSITLIVPFAAGGPTDVLARILAEHMRGTLGQTVLVENVTGASGAIAGLRAARATPDGTTLTIGQDRKSTRLNSSHANISYAVFCLKKKKNKKVH